MAYRRKITFVIEFATVTTILAIVVGSILGQPILLGYVETGSMEPTLAPGDGFIALPAALAGEVTNGDVIVFKPEEINEGELTTHRIVGVTERGYITKGDANPFTDQDGREPPVKNPQIVAKALQIGGSVVVIPGIGFLIGGVQNVLSGGQRALATMLGTRSLLGLQGGAYQLFGLSAIAYVADVLLNRDVSRNRQRTPERPTGQSVKFAIAGLALLLILAATTAMVVPAGNQEIGIVSAEFESDRPTVIPQGTTEHLQYTVPNSGFVPVHVYLEPASNGVDVEPRHVFVGSRNEAEVTVTLHAPDETGYYRRFVAEHRYLAILPEAVIRDLNELHPWAPIAVIDALLGGGLYAIGLLALGMGPARIRRRSRPYSPSVTARLKELLY